MYCLVTHARCILLVGIVLHAQSTRLCIFRVLSCYMHTALMLMKNKTNERSNNYCYVSVVQSLYPAAVLWEGYSVHVGKCPSDQWRPQTVVSMQLGQLLATVTLSMEASAFQRDMKYCTQGKFNLDPRL